MESAVDAAHGDISRTGVQVNVARAGLVHFNVTAAGAAMHRSRNFAGAHVAGAGLYANLSRQASQLQISRSALEVGITVNALDDLIPRSAVRTQSRIGGNGDVVVHRNVAFVHVIDVDVVAFLAEGRVLLDLADVGLTPSEEPAVADKDLSPNHNRAGRPGAHGDVARACEHFQIRRAADRECLLESALRGRSEGDGRCEQNPGSDQKRAGYSRTGILASTRIIHSVGTPQVSYPRRAGQDTCLRSR